MRIVNLLFFLCLLPILGSGQKIHSNIVLVLNDKVYEYNASVEVEINSGLIYQANYMPGDLKVDSFDITNDRLLLKFNLMFSNNQYKKYIVKIPAQLLKANFVIIKFYDIAEKKYSKLFVNYEQRGYVYDIISSEFSATALRKK